MTNPSELSRKLRKDADVWAEAVHTIAGPATAVLLREAADTIDRLTSTGVAVAASDVAKPMAARFFKAMTEADDRTSPAEYPDHILVTEYEVMIAMTTAIIDDRVQRRHVPVEWTAPLDHDELLGITEYLMKLADIDDPEADETDCEDLCGKRECKAVGCIVSKFRRVRAALPHNQGETKP